MTIRLEVPLQGDLPHLARDLEACPGPSRAESREAKNKLRLVEDEGPGVDWELKTGAIE
jgi:hypothetical protein